jgi:hypothetical protein
MKLLSEEARNAAAAATSDGSPTCPIKVAVSSQINQRPKYPFLVTSLCRKPVIAAFSEFHSGWSQSVQRPILT